jgi:hypothetical protein
LLGVCRLQNNALALLGHLILSKMAIPGIKSIGRVISKHTIRQLKFIIPGAAITYAFNTHHVFLELLTRQDVEGQWGRWATIDRFLNNYLRLIRLFAFASTGFEGLVIILFLYILLVPWIHGLEPDVSSFYYCSFILHN